MSDLTAGGPHGLGYTHVTGKWGWFVALGVGLILAGFVAFTLISVIFIGAAFLVGGVMQVIHAFMTKGWSAFALNLLCGLLTVAGGLLIMMEPVQGPLSSRCSWLPPWSWAASCAWSSRCGIGRCSIGG